MPTNADDIGVPRFIGQLCTPSREARLPGVAIQRIPSLAGKMPIVATTLELVREHGPAGPAF
ncbi:hypothetical protein [Streptomyces pseudogriseolus]|uniref:hypothetical protein n=1 Tax=Streptomyces pseudogriseolus TaxID=36817 RepID=UPI003FA25ABF